MLSDVCLLGFFIAILESQMRNAASRGKWQTELNLPLLWQMWQTITWEWPTKWGYCKWQAVQWLSLLLSHIVHWITESFCTKQPLEGVCPLSLCRRDGPRCPLGRVQRRGPIWTLHHPESEVYWVWQWLWGWFSQFWSVKWWSPLDIWKKKYCFRKE